MSLTVRRIVPLKKSSLADEIVGQMQRMVLGGELAAGHKLPPERELAQAFNVNRGTVREALKRLASLELVEIRHGDGIYVRSYLHSTNLDLLRAMLEQGGTVKRDVVKSLLDIRRIIVPEMASVAAKTRSNEDLEALERVVRGVARMTVMERDVAVHRIIAEASRNVPYLLLLNFFNAATQEIAAQFFDDELTRMKTEKIHKDLYAAMKHRQPAAARRIMAEALAGSDRRTLRLLEKPASERRVS